MTPKRGLAKTDVVTVRDGRAERRRDVLAVEEPLEIRLAGEREGRRFDENVSITMRTPGDDFELAAGFLAGEGILRAPGGLHEITYCVGAHKHEQQYNVVRVRLRAGVDFDPASLRRNFYITSSCGVCGKASLEALRLRGYTAPGAAGPTWERAAVHGLAEQLRAQQAGFEKTGALHAAALFAADGKLVAVREDVGRHNAVDKIVGERFLAGAWPLPGTLLLVSGRASFEILQKALLSGIPIVAAVGAPTSLAVDLAREYGITLLGFVRDGRFNIYAGEERLK